MKNKLFILDTKQDKILAIAETQDSAHLIAECLSYVANKNALYGAFGIKLAEKSEISPKASNEFYSRIQ